MAELNGPTDDGEIGVPPDGGEDPAERSSDAMRFWGGVPGPPSSTGDAAPGIPEESAADTSDLDGKAWEPILADFERLQRKLGDAGSGIRAALDAFGLDGDFDKKLRELLEGDSGGSPGDEAAPGT